MIWFTTWPFLKTRIVGIDIMLYLAAKSPSLSTLTLATLSFPCSSCASSSTIGLSILQGPHHSAQKSTKTGVGEFKTSDSKLLSVKCNDDISAPFDKCLKSDN